MKRTVAYRSGWVRRVIIKMSFPGTGKHKFAAYRGLCADAKFRLNGLATKEKSSAFGNGSKLLHREKSLLENYLTDSIHVKC